MIYFPDYEFIRAFCSDSPCEIDMATTKVWKDHNVPFGDEWKDLWDGVVILAHQCLKQSDGK